MSFSSEVKEEICSRDPELMAGHCRIAELAALTIHLGHYRENPERMVYFETGEEQTARRICKLLFLVCNIQKKPVIYSGTRRKLRILLNTASEIERFLLLFKLANESELGYDGFSVTSEIILMNVCCKKAFIRGSFLACGTMRDPDKGYRLEMVCSGPKKADQIAQVLMFFELEPKLTQRNDSYVVYIKEGAQVSDVFRIMGTNNAILEFENIRITREVRGQVNRSVNCETANINKTIAAAQEQIRDIELIREKAGLDSLPPELKEACLARLANDDISLKELGMIMNPPVGKSGMKHRFEKIKLLAEELRGI